MGQRDRYLIVFILVVIAIFNFSDIFIDLKSGTSKWHISVEVLVGGLALVGVYSVMVRAYRVRRDLEVVQQENAKLREQETAWRSSAKKHIEGLSDAIDQQLSKWNLSSAEKEVALLLLKGLSTKEIAQIRATTDKTVRVQSASVYTKSGLSGRSELSAFFLEDLLLPKQ